MKLDEKDKAIVENPEKISIATTSDAVLKEKRCSLTKEEKEDLRYILRAENEGFGIISEGYLGSYKRF